MIAIRRPHETELQLLEARSGRVRYRETIAATVKIVDVHQNRGILSSTHLTAPLRLEWFTLQSAGDRWTLQRSPLAAMPTVVNDKIVHCRAEKVDYPTFDMLDDGTRRMLHAFYLEPKVLPADPAQRLVLITSFYGGGNYYGEETHVLGAAGIATLSPAPRGSWGYGAEFAALNDRDLGGDEIVDIIYAARWLMEKKGYKPHQIGVRGGSHGGYATLRALTFPPETNGRGEGFDFGFGISHAGFSDILTFYESCNIPDWVLLEAGDPVTEREKLMDRSPIHHVERLQAPVLLTHGRNDWRVPVSESRRFVTRARALGKPVAYVEFSGQGHGIGGLQNKLDYYGAIFSFLESLDARRP
jgi:dipeptidyl aminopeptidase/acylaminoacyl peptidase